MKTVTCKGLNISVFSLGTVQLGMNYGINNTTGKPEAEKSNAILNLAMENGINILDTAGSYGDSEVVIGNWLKTVNPQKRPFIVTKVTGFTPGTYPAVKEFLQQKVAMSKERLGVEQLDMLMIHNFDEYLRDQDNVRQAMEELKADGDIRFTGASAYSHHDYGQIAETGFDATQIPINLFDWTQIENGGMEKLEKSGMIVFARSVFLQGLVFADPDHLPEKMMFARETLIKFRGLCKKYNCTPAVLAMSYVNSLPAITSLVLGCETPQQVQENVDLFSQCVSLSADQLSEIRSCFVNTPTRVLNPSLW
jgi:aryl-alcohol dehydrogenase-like predicted oxidoreductase